MSVIINRALNSSNSQAGIVSSGAISTQPVNPNYLSPLNFRFSMTRSPNLNFFVIRATLPQVSISSSSLATPFTNIPLHGNKITFNELDLNYRVDENLNNYLELFNWLTSIGHAEDFSGYNQLATNDRTSGYNIYSDATLTIFDSAKRPRNEILFHDLYPVTLGGMVFASDLNDINYITSTVSFKFREFTINQLP